MSRTLDGGCQTNSPSSQIAGDSRGLNLSGRDGGLLVICSELRSLSGNAFEDVLKLVSPGTREHRDIATQKHTVHEGVEDGHGTV